MNERAHRNRWSNLAPAPVRAGVRAVVENTTAPELLIYDFIDSWGGEWGVSAADVVTALAAIGDVPALTVRISSPGGDYFEGVSIYNALVRHPATVTVQVDSLAASAASVIAMAGNTIVMGMGAQLMIHEASSVAFGRADDMRAAAAMLDQTNDDIAGFYAARTGGDPAFWREAVKAETWYTAAQAVAAGLADEVAAPPTRTSPPPPPPDDPDSAAPAARTGEPAPSARGDEVAVPGGVLALDPALTPEQRQAVIDRFTTATTDQAPDAGPPAPDAPPAPELPTAAAFDPERLRSALREVTR